MASQFSSLFSRELNISLTKHESRSPNLVGGGALPEKRNLVQFNLLPTLKGDLLTEDLLTEDLLTEDLLTEDPLTEDSTYRGPTYLGPSYRGPTYRGPSYRG